MTAVNPDGESTGTSFRMHVICLVARDMSLLVNDDDECLNLVVDDVLRRWQGMGPDRRRAQPGGLDGFWDRYADQVEFAPPGSTDQYRAEFCPPESESSDLDAYYSAVWRAHATGLRRKAGAAAQGLVADLTGEPEGSCLPESHIETPP